MPRMPKGQKKDNGEKIDILRLQAYALTALGMPLDTFRRLSPGAFDLCMEEDAKRQHAQDLARWNRLRTACAILIQPHTSKRVTPRMLIPLEEIDAPAKAAPKREYTPSTRERVEELMSR